MLPSVCPGVWMMESGPTIDPSFSDTSGFTRSTLMNAPKRLIMTLAAPLVSLSFCSPESLGASSSPMASFAPVTLFSSAALPEWSASGWVRTMYEMSSGFFPMLAR